MVRTEQIIAAAAFGLSANGEQKIMVSILQE
jgi:hypothetical protein